MNKKVMSCVSMTATSLIAGFCLAGCAGTRIAELSGSEFLKQAEQIDQMSCFHWTSYIGSTEQRAYLEYGYPAFIGDGTRVTVYWTPISELPSDIVTKIKAGARPWKSWKDKIPKSADTPTLLPSR